MIRSLTLRFVMDCCSRVIRRKIKFRRAFIYENRYIILRKDYCLLRSPAILRYVIRNTVGMRNVLTFTGSECLTACIVKYRNSVRDNSIDRNSETIRASDTKQTATGSTLNALQRSITNGKSSTCAKWALFLWVLLGTARMPHRYSLA